MNKPWKIYLIGMPGSGKSYLGKSLAQSINLPFIDLDEVIVQKTGQTIAQYFESYGESLFRQVEQQALMDTIDGNHGFVLATGGGAPCFFDNMAHMNNTGLTIFLDTSKQVLLERNLLSAERPLMQGDVERKIDDLLDRRLSVYQKAHLTISDPADVEETAIRVREYFSKPVS